MPCPSKVGQHDCFLIPLKLSTLCSGVLQEQNALSHLGGTASAVSLSMTQICTSFVLLVESLPKLVMLALKQHNDIDLPILSCWVSMCNRNIWKLLLVWNTQILGGVYSETLSSQETSVNREKGATKWTYLGWWKGLSKAQRGGCCWEVAYVPALDSIQLPLYLPICFGTSEAHFSLSPRGRQVHSAEPASPCIIPVFPE